MKRVFKEHQTENPLRFIMRKNKVGWNVGNLTVFTPRKDNKIRNMLCSELKIKHLVFSDKGKNNHKKSQL